MPRRIHLTPATVEKLIGLVRENPCVFDINDSHYLDTQRANKVWDLIAKTMGISSVNGKGWRSKWKNLRDTYVKQRRQVRERRMGEEGPVVSKWRFYHLLAFLDPHMVKTEADATPDSQSDPEELDCEAYSVHENDGSTSMFLNESMAYEEAPLSPVCKELEGNSKRWSSDTSVVPSSGVCKKPKISDTWTEDGGSTINTDLRNFYQEGNFRHDRYHLQTNVTKDADLLLFESYALRMKKLPRETQSFIQLQMSQIFFNAENPNVEQIPIMRLPRHTAGDSVAQGSADGEPPRIQHCSGFGVV